VSSRTGSLKIQRGEIRKKNEEEWRKLMGTLDRI
jgi:hypothetical protein